MYSGILDCKSWALPQRLPTCTNSIYCKSWALPRRLPTCTNSIIYCKSWALPQRLLLLRLSPWPRRRPSPWLRLEVNSLLVGGALIVQLTDFNLLYGVFNFLISISFSSIRKKTLKNNGSRQQYPREVHHEYATGQAIGMHISLMQKQ